MRLFDVLSMNARLQSRRVLWRCGLFLALQITGWPPDAAWGQATIFSADPVWTASQAGRTVSMALGDVDGDGDLDLVCGNSGESTQLLLNEGGRLRPDPTWSVLSATTNSVALGDVDGNGYPDLVCGNYGQGSKLYLNRGGHLETTPTWSGPIASTWVVALGDVNGDGRLDLVCGTDSGVALYLNVGGQFAEEVDWSVPSGVTRSVAFGDVDGDGDLDLVCGVYGQPSLLYLNEGGRFALVPAWSGERVDTWSVALGDVNGDGRLDLVCGCNQGTYLYLNEDGRFGATPVLIGFPAATRSVVVGDVDADGDLDLVCGNYSQGAELYLNDQGVFGGTPAWEGPVDKTWSVILGDLDADGDLDLVCGNYTGKNTIYANAGRYFDTEPVWSVPGWSDAVAGDVDGDGRPDLICRSEQEVALFLNDGGRFGTVPAWSSQVGTVDVCRLVDVDQDGKLDLFCVSREGQSSLFLNEEGRFGSTPAWFGPQWQRPHHAIAVGDVNGDGYPDLVIGQPGYITLYLNQRGRLGTTPAQELPGEPYSMTLGDADGDGHLDLVCGFVGAGPIVYRNNGGLFDAIPAWTGPINVAFGVGLADVNGDGNLDLVCSGSEGVTFFMNEGETFASEPSSWRAPGGTTFAVGDVNGDGESDILCGGPNGYTLYLGQNGTFAAEPAQSWGTGYAGVGLYDIDQDGDLDLVRNNANGAALFLGTVNPPYRWTPTAPTHQLPNNDAYLRWVRLNLAAENRYRIRLTAIDLESDSVWVVPEYQYSGEPVWRPMNLIGFTGRVGPLAAAPEGVEHELEWDVLRLPMDSRPVVLRLRTISNPDRAGTVQRIPTYLAAGETLKIRRPALATEVASISFQGATVGDRLERSFALRNDGNAPLEVTRIVAPSTYLRCEFPLSVSIQPGDRVVVPVFFEPLQAVDISDSLRFESNDPIRPAATIGVSASAQDLIFATRPIFETDLPPLGEALKIMIIPEAGVRIGHGAIYYRPLEAPSETPYIRVNLSRFLSTALVGTIPAEAVTEQGVSYYVLVANGSVFQRDPCRNRDACRDSTALPDTVFVQQVQPAGWISATPPVPQGTRFFAGGEIQIELAGPQGMQYRGATLYYRKGGDQSYHSVPFDPATPSFATIPGDSATARGIEYWAEARTWASTLTDPADSPQTVPHALRVAVRSLEETRVHPAERYRMFSVPLDFGSQPSASLQAMFSNEDALGAYDPARWRAFRYLPGEASGGGNIEITSGEREGLLPRPGRGFWLISRAPHQIDTAPLEGLSMPTEVPFPIVLAPGWNQIGNPFAFPVARVDIRYPAGADSLTAFDPNLGEHGGYVEGPVRILEPFEGYFIFDSSVSPETLWVSPMAAGEAQLAAGRSWDKARRGPPWSTDTGPAGSAEARSAEDWPSEAWALRLPVRSQRAADAATIVGVHPDAVDERDGLDRREPPPPPGDWVQLAIDDAGWRHHAGAYSQDWRAPRSAGHAWNLEIRSAERGEIVRLEPVLMGQIPPGFEIRLVDLEEGSAVAMPLTADGMESCRLAVLSYGPDRPYLLRLVAGTPSFVEAETGRLLDRPEAVVLQQSSPNPFSGSTRIRFGLPMASQVTVEVFDAEGARVAQLAQGQRYAAGYHTLIWDGTATTNHPAPSGIYFYRLTSGETRLTRRLIRLK